MKFNTQTSIEKKMAEHTDAMRNYEDGLSYSVDPETELYFKAATCLVGEPKFYESAEQADNGLIQSIHEVLRTNPEFVLQLAVYCREQMYLRSVPLVLCAEYANVAPGTVQNARKYISQVIQRADELTEMISYQLNRNKISPRTNKLPMAIKHGVADAFTKFDAYQLAKYNRIGAVTLRDVMFLTHPKPKTEQQKQTWDKLVNKTLETPITWETQRSSGKMTWHDVIRDVFFKDGKVNNYMALLRNLRNILQSPDVTNDDMILVSNMLSDKNAVLKSKQLPFRFLSAYRIVKEIQHQYINRIIDSLEYATSVAMDNVPKLHGTTLIACDVSGSMTGQPISKNSTIKPYDIGIMFGSMAHKICENSITGIFGTTWKQIPMSVYAGILQNVDLMHKHDNDVGWSTNGYQIIKYLLDNNIDVDRIMVFTDCQMYDSYGDQQFAPMFKRYQQLHPSVKLYSFDLNGYGNVMIPQDTKNVCMLSGWSDRVFDFVKAFESAESQSAIQTIKSIKV